MFVTAGDGQVVRHAGPARGRHLAADDHAVRELHPGGGTRIHMRINRVIVV